jgi:histidine triad (HIT) family protein
MEPSIFTKIIQGDIPCHKVYEDEKTFAFMDIHPIAEGMVLVIPKHQIDHFEDLPDDLLCAVMLTSKKVMRALRRVYPDKVKIALQVEGLEVPHVHVKLFPIDNGVDFHALPDDGEPDHEKLATIAQKIQENL